MTIEPRTMVHHKRRRARWPLIVGAVFMLVLAVVYARLIIGPQGVPFLQDTAEQYVNENLPDGFTAEFGGAGIAIENGVRPMIVLSPMTVHDVSSGATISLDSVRVAFSPVAALFGRPAAELILDTPQVQIFQDFSGVRLASLEFTEGEDELSTVRVLENRTEQQTVTIDESGIGMGSSAELVSDNDWIQAGVNALEGLFADLGKRFTAGELRQIEVRDASVEMMDGVYRLYRHFEAFDLLIEPEADEGVRIALATEISGRDTTARITWQPTSNETSKVIANIVNVDLAVFLPVLDDEEGYFSVKGGSNVDLELDFGDEGIRHGRIVSDISATWLQIFDDFYAITSEPTIVEWRPQESTFELLPTRMSIGQSWTTIQGTFVLGVDENYGPTVGILFKATDTILHPEDLETPGKKIELVEFQGWSASVYGAIGVDKVNVRAGGLEASAEGRFDFIQKGLGINLDVAMRGGTVDQVKRIWPYFIGKEFRDQFVQIVAGGQVTDATFKVRLDPGTVSVDGFTNNRVPAGGIRIEARARDLELAQLEGTLQFDIDGPVSFLMNDNAITFRLDRGFVREGDRSIEINNLAYLNTDVFAPDQVFEVSGDVTGNLGTVTSFANREPFKLLEDIELDVDPESMTGDVAVTLIANVLQDATGRMSGTDYTLNGSVQNFASSEPIGDYMIDNGMFNVVASQAGYQIVGKADIDGVPTDLDLHSGDAGELMMTASAELDNEAREALGFGFEQFLDGTVRFVSRPVADDVLQIAVDLTDASLTIADIAVNKPKGTPGQLTAAIRPDGDVTKLEQVELTFGDVRLAGELTIDKENQLRGAQFSTFRLNANDSAALSIDEIDGGYAISLTGEQLDLKPVLQRFLGLGEKPDAVEKKTQLGGQTFQLNLQLDRALGFYSTTAYNFRLNLALEGTEMQRISAQGQLGDDRNISITTNPLPRGRSISVGTNDMGTLLRFTGTYPRMIGGTGSLVIDNQQGKGKEQGEFVLRNFTIVDESKVAEVMGNHRQSAERISNQNRVNFEKAQVSFQRSGDVITITEGAVHGDSIGGTVRGNIYTKAGRYDLAGTYVPLFGLNNMFQQLPIFGRLLGGREGEGLVGVTFKVEGPLDNPDFRVNPASVLAPGVFRRLFEFRTEDPANVQQ
ncbi:AsmA-like C-terminal domain-containing protein [Cucumibacter marinus]|uniref:AsmA-like C-terminal domain-containing protein n=1 Tax=Cucumibacter marinus TaxID=1121252 RepID=UPI0012DEF2CB|nr:AsmA-like C-terminal domain-containing protein [Cucumibacter marinus]